MTPHSLLALCAAALPGSAILDGHLTVDGVLVAYVLKSRVRVASAVVYDGFADRTAIAADTPTQTVETLLKAIAVRQEARKRSKPAPPPGPSTAPPEPTPIDYGAILKAFTSGGVVHARKVAMEWLGYRPSAEEVFEIVERARGAEDCHV